MAAPSSALSQTVKSITLTKIKELDKQREKYETRKTQVLLEVNGCPDRRARISLLLKGVQDLYPDATKDKDVSNMRKWLYQSRYDASVPDELLQNYEESLRSKLEIQTRRLSLGHLYAQLVTEWMNASSDDEPGSDQDEAFEVVDRQKQRLQELCDKFERVVFEPLETDELEIDLYLQQLFEDDDGKGAKALDKLRKTIKKCCDALFADTSPFNASTLTWCIKGLLAEKLLSDEKQEILRKFLDDHVVLGEMADVLNMRFSDIEHWDWDAGEHGIPVLPRQELNGKYRIWMDEDVLQAILIHYIGIKCCVSLKSTLNEFVDEGDTWTWQTGPKPTSDDITRRQYYVGNDLPSNANADNTLSRMRRVQYVQEFFASQLPKSEHTISVYDSDEQDAQQREDTMSVKQKLLHTLASDLIVNKTLHDEAAIVQTDLEWFATGLSHSTIFAVMRFFGYPDKVIQFFKKMLEAPLNVQSSPDDPSTNRPRTRRRGVPIAHAPEKLMGELVLFVLDLVVNREQGMLLYRLHDDLWLCGQPDRCAKAWTAVGQIADVLGLHFNKGKTGSVYLTANDKEKRAEVSSVLPEGDVKIGHLMLDQETGKWRIDQEQVENHVRQLKKQLDGCESVLQWAQTWNSCIGRFFSHTFGQPAYCFGPEHVDSILETYQWMQGVLFDVDEAGGGRSVVGHIKSMILQRFGVSDVPDAFVYLPAEMGGLGLRNPFIPMLEVRDELAKHAPEGIISDFLDREREDYKEAKAEFDKLDKIEARLLRCTTRHGHGGSVDSVKEVLTAEELKTFITFDEFIKWREVASRPLAAAYAELRETPPPANGSPYLDNDVESQLWNTLGMDPNDQNAPLQMREMRWALQMYHHSMQRDFGGLNLVDKRYLPLGVLAMMRSRAVKWTMVL